MKKIVTMSKQEAPATLEPQIESGFSYTVNHDAFKAYVTEMALMHSLDHEEIIDDMLKLVKWNLVKSVRGG